MAKPSMTQEQIAQQLVAAASYASSGNGSPEFWQTLARIVEPALEAAIEHGWDLEDLANAGQREREAA